MMSIKAATVSVIIPTKDRVTDLVITIQTLLPQSVLLGELIIVDQSRDPESRAQIERLYAEADDQIRQTLKLIYISDVGLPGSAAARNRAMEMAQGAVWLFLDDDVQLEPNFIEELLAVFDRYPNVVGVSGIITNYRPPAWTSRAWTTIFAHGPFFDERQPIYWDADRLRESEPIPVTRIGSGLMSFRAESIRNVRFDENLRGVPGGEDVDFCMRLKRGSIIVIAPRARLVHKQSPSAREKTFYLRKLVRTACYLYWRNWDTDLKNRFFFTWLLAGYVLLATVSGLKRLSWEPWQSLLQGMRDARAQLSSNPKVQQVERGRS
jgi:GT2 family glycosyltransferase